MLYAFILLKQPPILHFVIFAFYYFQVYESVMIWVTHEAETRRHDLPLLMECVRLPLLSQDYLVQNVEENQLMRSNAQCRF